ncbi:MAG TPA: glycosyltransferase family 39 protein [Humisphaera sp.]
MPRPSHDAPLPRPVALVAFALLVLLPGLGRRDVITSHEARVVQTARQMAASGWPWAAEPVRVPVVALVAVTDIKIERLKRTGEGDRLVNPWLVPVLVGNVRLQKPPLPYWCSAVCIKVLGDGAWQARLPMAVCGALSAGLVYGIARRAFGRRAGWLAGLAWVSLYFAFDEHRKAMADPVLSFCCLLAVWAWVRWATRQAGRSASRSLLDAMTFYVPLALANLAKGPVAIALVGVALATFHLCLRRRLPGRWWHHVAGLIAFAAVALPWPAYVVATVPHAVALWRYESVGRFDDNVEKARAWWFYGPTWLQILLPWTPLWVACAWVGVVRWARATRRRSAGSGHLRRHLWPVLWAAAALLFFSASHVKKPAYLLPVVPAAAVTVGLGMRRLSALARARRHRFPAWGWPASAAVVALATALLFDLALAPADNRRSAKAVATEACSILAAGGHSIGTNDLSEEVAVYLSVDVRGAVPASARTSPKVLFVWDDLDGVAARRRGQPFKRFDPTGWMIDGGRVTAFRRLPIPKNPGDVRWQLWELTVERSGTP